MTPGHVPEARVAWTGNLVLGIGLPFLIEGGAAPYLRTIERFDDERDVETIVPGHGPIVPGAVLGAYRGYLGELLTAVEAAPSDDSLDAVLARLPLRQAYMPPGLDEDTRAFIEGIHVFNVWRILGEARAASTPPGL